MLRKYILLSIFVVGCSSIQLFSSFEPCLKSSKAVLEADNGAYQKASKDLAAALKKYKEAGGDINKLVVIKKLLEKSDTKKDSEPVLSRQVKYRFQELSYDEQTMLSLLMVFTFGAYQQEVQSLMNLGAKPLYEAINGLNALDIAIIRLAISSLSHDTAQHIEILQELLGSVSKPKKAMYCSQSLQKLRKNPAMVQELIKGLELYQVMACLSTTFERKLIAQITGN